MALSRASTSLKWTAFRALPTSFTNLDVLAQRAHQELNRACSAAHPVACTPPIGVLTPTPFQPVLPNWVRDQGTEFRETLCRISGSSPFQAGGETPGGKCQLLVPHRPFESGLFVIQPSFLQHFFSGDPSRPADTHDEVPLIRHLVITATGRDTPGLVSRLTKKVLEFGGNVEQSRMARLAGEYSIIMLVSVDSSSPRVCEQLRQRLTELEGLQVTARWTMDERTKETGPRRKFRRLYLSGADNPGLVYNVTEYLASQKINIENLDTATEEAPFGGTTLFRMEGVIAMPISMSTAHLVRCLQVLESSLGVQIEISNMDPHSGAEDIQTWKERLGRVGGVSKYSLVNDAEPPKGDKLI